MHTNLNGIRMKTAVATTLLFILPLMSVYDVPPPDSENVGPAIRASETLVSDAAKIQFKSEDAKKAVEQARSWLERAKRPVDTHQQ